MVIVASYHRPPVLTGSSSVQQACWQPIRLMPSCRRESDAEQLLHTNPFRWGCTVHNEFVNKRQRNNCISVAWREGWFSLYIVKKVYCFTLKDSVQMNDNKLNVIKNSFFYLYKMFWFITWWWKNIFCNVDLYGSSSRPPVTLKMIGRFR